MFLPVGIDHASYDYSGLATSSESSPSAVGAYVDTSGVKAGALVLAIFEATIATGAEVDINVYAAWKLPNGQLLADLNTPVATFAISATIGSASLVRVNFGTLLPCPGLVVYVSGKRGANAGAITAAMSVGLELLAA